VTVAAKNIEERLALFWAKVEVRGPNECWPWTAALYDNGYGSFAIGGGRSRRAHRWIWEHTYGELPTGVVLHHTCEMRHCMNMNHMEPLDSQSDHALLHGIGGDWRRYL